MSRFSEKAFIVTGAGSGIGAATARKLATEGASIVAADISEDNLRKTVNTITADGGTAYSTVFDLGEEASIIRLVDDSIQKLGRLNGVVNASADVSQTTMALDKEIGSFSVELWEHVINVNLIGTGLVVRQCLPHLVAEGGGSIVNISSAAAWLGEGLRPAYATSKIGLHALTRHTARAWGKEKIRCNVIAPGLVLTEAARALNSKEILDATLANMCLGRLGEPDDLAGTIAFLLSDDASWITGQVLSVDGGLTLRE